jgi:hypothetical protein
MAYRSRLRRWTSCPILNGIEAVIADDRSLNKLAAWTDPKGTHAISGSSLSILAALQTRQQITEEEYWRLRHKLRLGGYYAMPLEPGELRHHVEAAPVVDGGLRETPELRAIRESISLPQVNVAFIASEVLWLNGIRFAVFRAIRELWANASNLDEAEARSDWLLSILPYPPAWCLEPDNDAVWSAARQQAAIQVALLMVFPEATGETQRRYFAWLDKKYVEPIRRDHPEIWDAAVEFLKVYIARLTEGRNDE